jgi:hypothetical protein
MATDSNILREYLIALGFKVDAPGEKRMDAAVKRADLNVLGLAKRVVAAGVATQAFVALWARSMERLAYSSVKADTTASRLKELAFGASMVGVSGDEMTAAIEGMASAVRTNPGLRGFIESLGVSTKGQQMGDVMTSLLEKAKAMPHHIGAGLFQEMFGISEPTYLLLTQGLEKMKEMAALRGQVARDAGLDPDKAAAVGKEYAGMLRDIGMRLDVLKDQLGVTLIGPAKELARYITMALDAFTKALPDNIDKMSKATPLGVLTSGPGIAASGIGSLWNWLTSGFAANPGGSRKVSGAVGQTGGALPFGMRHNNPGNIMSGPGVTMGTYGSMEEGLGAMASLLLRYQQWGRDTITKIISKYAPPTKNGKFENDTASYIKNIAGALGVGADDALNLKDPKVLAALMQAMVAIEQGKPASQIGAGSYLVAAQAANGITVTQQTDITVIADNPESAGKQVAREQGRVGADLVRNLGSLAVR